MPAAAEWFCSELFRCISLPGLVQLHIPSALPVLFLETVTTMTDGPEAPGDLIKGVATLASHSAKGLASPPESSAQPPRAARYPLAKYCPYIRQTLVEQNSTGGGGLVDEDSLFHRLKEEDPL